MSDFVQYRDVTVTDKLFSIRLLNVTGTPSLDLCERNILARSLNQYFSDDLLNRLISVDTENISDVFFTMENTSFTIDCYLNENNGMLEIEVNLNRNIGKDLEIPINVVEVLGDDLSVDRASYAPIEQQVRIEPQTLLFEASSWDTPQSFRLTLLDDWKNQGERNFRVILGPSSEGNEAKISNYQSYLFCSSVPLALSDCFDAVEFAEIFLITLNIRMLEGGQSISVTPLFDNVLLGEYAVFRVDYRLLEHQDLEIIGVRNNIDSENLTDATLISNASITGYSTSDANIFTPGDLFVNENFRRNFYEGMFFFGLVFDNNQRLWNYPIKDFILETKVASTDSLSILSRITIENPNVAEVFFSSPEWEQGILNARTFLVEGLVYPLNVFLSSVPYDDVIIRFDIPDIYREYLSIVPDELLFTNNTDIDAFQTVELHLLDNRDAGIDNISFDINVISQDIFYMQHPEVTLTSEYIDADRPSIYYQLDNSTLVLEEGDILSFSLGVTIPPTSDLEISFNASFFNISDLELFVTSDLSVTEGFVEETEEALEQRPRIILGSNHLIIPAGFTGRFNSPLTIFSVEDEIQFPDTNYRISFSLETEDPQYENFVMKPIIFSLNDNDEEIELLRRTSQLQTSMIELACSDTLNTITRDLTLQTLDAEDGTTLLWTSNNSSVLSDDGTISISLYSDMTLQLNAKYLRNYVFVNRALEVTVLSKYKRFESGCGSMESPFLISNLDDLVKINFYLASHFSITNDIDATETKNWPTCTPNSLFHELTDLPEIEYCRGFPPIGLVSSGSIYNIDRFIGSIRGNGYTISNLFMEFRLIGHIQGPDTNSLLSWGFISNLYAPGELINIKFIGLKQILHLTELPFVFTGGVVGVANGNIDAVNVFGSLEISHDESDRLNHKVSGGVVGIIYTATGRIVNSSFLGNINNVLDIETPSESIQGPRFFTGGVIGNLESLAVADNIYSGGSINTACTNCWNVVGGLIGRFVNYSRLSRGYSHMSISSNNGDLLYLGGLIGRGSLDSYISNSFATSQISGIGSFVSVGGAISWGQRLNIYNTYANGAYQVGTKDSQNSFNSFYGVYTGCLIGRALGSAASIFQNLIPSVIRESSGDCSQNIHALSVEDNINYDVYLGGLVGFSEANIQDTYSKVEFNVYSSRNTVNQGGISAYQINAPISRSYTLWNALTSLTNNVSYERGSITSTLHSTDDGFAFLQSSYASTPNAVDLVDILVNGAIIDHFSGLVSENDLRCPEVVNDRNCISNLFYEWSPDVWDFRTSLETPVLRHSTSNFDGEYVTIGETDFIWLNSSYEIDGVAQVLISKEDQRSFAMINQMFSSIDVSFAVGDSFEGVQNMFSLELTELQSFANSNIDWTLSVQTNAHTILVVSNNTISVQNPSDSAWHSIKVLLTYRQNTIEEYYLEKVLFFYVLPSTND